MEATRNLCAQIPISLHDKVREPKGAGEVPAHPGGKET